MAVQKIGVIGAGAWGSALAVTAHRAGREVVLWARRPELAQRINAEHVNQVYLPGVPLDPDIRATPDVSDVAGADALLLVVPAQHLREVCARLVPHIPAGLPLVICAKGIEQGTNRLMSEVLAEVAPDGRAVVLSGPTFASEVGRGLPTAVTLAAEDADLGAALIEALGSRTFRPYLSIDLIGAQICGAVKNVIAIACGVVAGRALGDNARAALITRGLAEIARLGRVLGARPETLMGLSGLGDLTLTCTSMTSRNYSLGRALGEGEPLQDIMAGRRSVAEGVHSASAVAALASHHGVEMPITRAVDAILNRGAGIDEEIQGLLARPFTAETA